jgi:hypothetical protein
MRISCRSIAYKQPALRRQYAFITKLETICCPRKLHPDCTEVAIINIRVSLNAGRLQLGNESEQIVAVTKRIVEYHIGRLQDKNRDVRLKSIAELNLLCDPDSMEALQSVFQNDPDEEVRKAAREAGRKIFLNNQQGKASDGRKQ